MAGNGGEKAGNSIIPGVRDFPGVRKAKDSH
jgi:hypothetical protein